MNYFKIVFITFIVIFFSASSSFSFTDADTISDIDKMVSLFGTKANIQLWIERIVKYGEPAVKHLIDKYNAIKDEKRWPIVVCLSQIPTDASINFLKDILKHHEGRYSTSATIKNFPIEYEDGILPMLIELLTVQPTRFFRWDTSERLKEMTEREPERAGFLISNLKNDTLYKDRNEQIYEILEYVSGYHHWSWAESKIEPKTEADFITLRNSFWHDWWSKNKSKDQVEWLGEHLSSDNEWRRAHACAVLGSLNDPKIIPFLLKSLDDNSQRVRYWAVIGLKKWNNTYPSGGYLFEVFKQEEREEIKKLKEYFKD